MLSKPAHLFSAIRIPGAAFASASFLAPLLLATLLIGMPLAGAQAQAIERLGDFSDWSAFKYEEGGNLICFMASEPTKAEGNYTRRGEIHAMVTHRPGENRIDEVSIRTGYPYQEQSLVDVQIGALKAQLFTEGESAWAVDKETDTKLVQAMIKGNTMVIQGTSARGNNTTDTYSLSGFTRAYRAIGQACGL